MLFITSWTVPPENRDKAIARFKQSGGGVPPAGVKMIGRWHAADLSSGFGISEASDAQGLAKWALDWSDLLVIETKPALDDLQFAKVLGA